MRIPIIEVAVPADTSTTERGNILERLSRTLLETQHYKVAQQVRLTGMEVDLIAEHLQTGETVFVECKAQRQTISADVLETLMGKIAFRRASSAWLISTFALGKEAKGLKAEWEQRDPEDRRRLQIYDPESLIDRLITAKIIVSPDSLMRPDGLRYYEEPYLLITSFGQYWAIVVMDDSTGLRESALLFDATNGKRVVDEHVLSKIAQTDSSIAGLSWLPEDEQSAKDQSSNLRVELQSIVQVPMAEHWADYRPARPEDFVGRDRLLVDITAFFDNIRTQASTTRLLAIKGPSGWGKSSSVLKIRALAGGRRKNVFVYAVDSRAAASKRFGELALFTAISEAIKADFVLVPEKIAFGGSESPFATNAMRALLAALRNEQKVICLIFDQFEELLYKEELDQVFAAIRTLCDAVDEAQENVVVGFSWKTDGTVPADHGAYHLWHSLAERRYEFELTPFSAGEVTVALNRFEKELAEPLTPQLRRLLRDHCQGYPWLLKKLCIHVLERVRAGMDQSEILSRSLSIKELFDRDLQDLDQAETSCLREISREGPAEFFRVVDRYGNEVVSRLINKRLVIRSGQRLSVYWDIFRDYLLTGNVPYIPINYIPVNSSANYVAGLRYLLRHRTSSYAALAVELNIGTATVDNLVRDFVMIGHASSNRKSETVDAIHETEEEAAQSLLEFFRSHIVYRHMLADFGDTMFSADMVKRLIRRVITWTNLSDSMFDAYGNKLLRWFVDIGLVERLGRTYVLRPNATSLQFMSKAMPAYLRRGLNMFLAEAPPQRAVAALRDIFFASMSRGDVANVHGRNTYSTLMNLGLVDAESKVQIAVPREGADPEVIVRNAAYASSTICFVRDFLRNNPSAAGERVGDAVAAHFGFTWAVGSKRRYGAALRQWALWTSPELKQAVVERLRGANELMQPTLPLEV